MKFQVEITPETDGRWICVLEWPQGKIDTGSTTVYGDSPEHAFHRALVIFEDECFAKMLREDVEAMRDSRVETFEAMLWENEGLWKDDFAKVGVDIVTLNKTAMAAAIALFESGDWGPGYAAESIGIPRVSFLRLVGLFGVAVFQTTPEELVEDCRQDDPNDLG